MRRGSWSSCAERGPLCLRVVGVAHFTHGKEWFYSIGRIASMTNDLSGTANDVTWTFPAREADHPCRRQVRRRSARRAGAGG